MSCEEIAIDLESIIFVKEESSCGVIPTIVGTDAVLLSGSQNFKQEQDFAADNQKRPTNSMLPKLATKFKVGEYALDTYIKPVSAGVAPAGGVLLKANWGKETIVGGVSTEYAMGLVTEKVPTVTIVYGTSNMVFWNIGCTVDKGTYPISAGDGDDSIGRANFTGQFLRQKWAGTSAINDVAGYIATDTVLIVDDVDLYTDESRVVFEAEDNGGLGYLIESVQKSANTITIAAPGLAGPVADDVIVSPWYPTPVITGSMISGVLGDATIAAVTVLISNAVVELTNNFKILTDEKSGVYPVSITRPNKRILTINFEEVFRNITGERFILARDQTALAIVLPVGNVTGLKYEFQIDQATLNTPDVTGEEELRLANTGEGFATVAYNDEATMMLN